MGELGKRTAINLIKMINDENYNANFEFETEIVERESVKNMANESIL